MQLNRWLKRYFWVIGGIVLCLVLAGCSGITNSEDPEAWQPTLANCWPCGVYGSVFQVINDVARISTESSVELARVLLAMGLALYLAFQIGKMFWPFVETQDMVKMGYEAAFVVLKAMMIFILLANGTFFLEFIKTMVLMPVGEFFTILSNAVLDSMPGTGEYFGALPGIEPNVNRMVVDTSGKLVTIDVADSLFDTLGIQVQYIVSRIYRSLQTGIPLVLRMFAQGGVYAWFVGFIAGGEIFKLMVIFPVAFVDSFIQIAYVIILSPILLALWVFPGQDKYIKKVFPSYVMGPFMDILFGCIFVVFMITTLKLYTELCTGGLLNQETQSTNPEWADSAVSGGPNVIIMGLLIMAISKLCFVIYDFTILFGGQTQRGSLMELMDKAMALARKALLALATGGSSMAKEAAKQAAIEAAKKAAASASGGGGGGGGP